MKYCAPPAIGSIFSPDTPSMNFNEPATNCQTQANSATASFATTLHLIKAIKDPVYKVRGNTWSRISYMHNQPRVFARLLLIIGG